MYLPLANNTASATVTHIATALAAVVTQGVVVVVEEPNSSALSYPPEITAPAPATPSDGVLSGLGIIGVVIGVIIVVIICLVVCILCCIGKCFIVGACCIGCKKVGKGIGIGGSSGGGYGGGGGTNVRLKRSGGKKRRWYGGNGGSIGPSSSSSSSDS